MKMNVQADGIYSSEVTVKCSSDDVLKAFVSELVSGLGVHVKTFIVSSSIYGFSVTVYLNSFGCRFLCKCIDKVNRMDFSSGGRVTVAPLYAPLGRLSDLLD